jgi:hypothetical protein
MNEQPRKPHAILPPPRPAAAKPGSKPRGSAARSSMKEMQAKAMTKLLASFGPEEHAEYEKLKQMRMKKKKRR